MKLLFIICTLAAADIAVGMKYEDNILHVQHQQASDFTSVEQMLWVKKQTPRTNNVPGTRCQAMWKLRFMGGNTYQYIIYFAPPNVRTRLTALVTTLTTGITGNRYHDNTLSYKAMQGGQVGLFKLMYADKQNSCFILVTSRRSRERGCRLLQTSRTVDLPIPDECNRVFAQNCPGDVKEIYYSFCGARLPTIVQWGR
uniref:Lipocalin/cytosolic fatty-acid binding domain-containing protein n=1 Tax=Amblyomma maculatum TaxID=34609 RepID=G3MSM6_AMBMU